MKTLCAWCVRLIKLGSPEEISHGICRHCHALQTERLDEKTRPRKTPRTHQAPKPFTPLPRDEFREPFQPPLPDFDWLAFLQGQMTLSIAVGCAFFLVLLAAEGLHWATGGITPSLI